MPASSPVPSSEDLPVWDQALSAPVFEAIRPKFDSFKFPELPPEFRRDETLDLKVMAAWIGRKLHVLGKGRPVAICFANDDPKAVRPDAFKFRALFDQKIRVALGAQCFKRIRITTQEVQREDCLKYNLHSEPLAVFFDKDDVPTMVGPGGVEPQKLEEAMRTALKPDLDLDKVLREGVQLVKDLQAFAKEKAVLLEKRRRLPTASKDSKDMDKFQAEVQRLESLAESKEKGLLQREKDLFGD